MDIHEYIGRYTVLKKLKKNLLEGERRGGEYKIAKSVWNMAAKRLIVPRRVRTVFRVNVHVRIQDRSKGRIITEFCEFHQWSWMRHVIGEAERYTRAIQRQYRDCRSPITTTQPHRIVAIDEDDPHSWKSVGGIKVVKGNDVLEYPIRSLPTATSTKNLLLSS